jgi:hypothetical protein
MVAVLDGRKTLDGNYMVAKRLVYFRRAAIFR